MQHLLNTINLFWKNRPPGIYKEDYIIDLFQLYGDVDDAPPAPALPMWHCEAEDDDNSKEDPPEAEGGITYIL